MSMPCIIVDVDGTLADCGWRVKYVTNGNHDWDAFFSDVDKDGLYVNIRDLVELLSCHYWVCICTGRPERLRAITEEWLSDNHVVFDELRMRPDDDMSPDHDVKEKMLDEILAKREVFVVIDDRQTVVDMWRRRGLTCLQCRDPKEDAVLADDDSGNAVLTLMVGPSGSGKSTWIANDGPPREQVISTDKLRHEYTGDFRDQSANSKVFAAVHALVRCRLQHGLSVTVDATNIRNKDRKALRDLARPTTKIEYVVINRDIEDKRATAGWRADVKVKGGQFLIDAHENTFQQNLSDILRGDDDPRVTVVDRRQTKKQVDKTGW